MPLIANYFWSPFVLPFLGARVKLIHDERIDRQQSYLIMANHNSFIDIPVLFKTMPFFTYFIVKKELQKIPLLGWFIAVYGMIYVDRSDSSKAKESLAKAAKLIAAGKHVIIFPEGTKSKDGKIAPFKKGGFHLAAAANVPILPIKIVGADKVWPNKKPFKLSNGKIDVIVGEPIFPETLKDMDINQQTSFVRDYILSL